MKGVLIPILSIKIIKNPGPNEESREILEIDVLNYPNPCLRFHSLIPVPNSEIPFSQLMKTQDPIQKFNSPVVLFIALIKSHFMQQCSGILRYFIFLSKSRLVPACGNKVAEFPERLS